MVKGGKNKGKSNIKPNLSNKSAKAFVGLVVFFILVWDLMCTDYFLVHIKK